MSVNVKLPQILVGPLNFKMTNFNPCTFKNEAQEESFSSHDRLSHDFCIDICLFRRFFNVANLCMI